MAKSKLTPENVSTFIEAIKDGNYRKHAAALIGADERTVKRWMSLGELPKAKEPFKSFAAKVVAAEGESLTEQVRNITRAGKKDWRASAWYVARKAANEFGTKALQGATHDDRIKDQLNALLECVEDVLGRDDAARVLDEIARRAGKPEVGPAVDDDAGTGKRSKLH